MNQAIGNKAISLMLLKGWYPELVPDFMTYSFDDLIEDWVSIKERATACLLDWKPPQDGRAEPKVSNWSDSKLSTLLDQIRVKPQAIQMILSEGERMDFRKVSLRTSAALEDHDEGSFAGQYRTLLDQNFEKDVLVSGISALAKSLFSRNVAAYLRMKRLSDGTGQDGCVIIQRMFVGKKSGVAFTENGRCELVISFSDKPYGGVVEGEKAQLVTIDKKRPLTRTSRFGLPPALAEACLRLERRVGLPLDIEWAVDGDTVALLQYRPLTVPQDRFELELDCTNIAENYPGVTSPLTYSFIRSLYSKVYPGFLRRLTVPRSTLSANDTVFRDMLGYHQGAVYYNISNWYRLIAFLPGYSLNKEFFEAMLCPARKAGSSRPELQGYSRFRQCIAGIRFVWFLFRADGEARRFETKFESSFNRWSSLPWATLDARTIFEAYETMEAELLQDWTTPILNDFRTMVFHGMAKKLLSKDGIIGSAALAGISEDASLQPVRELNRLAIGLRQAIGDEGPDGEIWEKVENDPSLAEWKKRMEGYLERYGSRVPGELKLETPRFTEDMDTFLRLVWRSASELRPGSSGGEPDADLGKENQLFTANQDRPGWILRMVLRHAKSGIGWRERFRFRRAQVFSVARDIFLELGKRLRDGGVLEETNDVFFLTKEQVRDAFMGHSLLSDLKGIVRIRKVEMDQNRKSPHPRRLYGYGQVPGTFMEAEAPGETKQLLSGIGASPGKAIASAVVMLDFDPNVDLSGKILVTYSTDPGWTLLFYGLAGIVVERGNALSHASIVARELGIPAVAGAEGACESLCTGMRLEIDGHAGTVRVGS